MRIELRRYRERSEQLRVVRSRLPVRRVRVRLLPVSNTMRTVTALLAAIFLPLVGCADLPDSASPGVAQATESAASDDTGCTAGWLSCRVCVETGNGHYGFCTNQCENPNNDVNNCGGCGVVCGGANPLCDNGTCRCGGTDCNGVCVLVVNDPNNCGTCGHVCPSGECSWFACL